MCDVDFTRSRPSSRRGRTLRAGRAVPLLLLALVLLLGACDTARGPDPGDPAPEEPAPGDPATPDLSRVEVELEPLAASGEGAFERPLGVVSDGAGDALYVMQQGGVVDVIEADGSVRDEPFLDLSDRVEPEGEAGLLGLVFHPDYPEPRDVFVHYTPLSETGELRTVVSRMPVSDEGVALSDEANEDVLFETVQPSVMHNGGQLAFGPDGMLYVAVGEGATTEDPEEDGPYEPGPPGNPDAVGPESPLGTILRIDPDAPDADHVPSDNPFAGDEAGHDHVWVYGLRNPWRFSFDPATGDLWLADVGEGRVEEINHVPDAELTERDFGWNRMEGDLCVDPAGCEDVDAVEPAITYPTDVERGSVTGGYVYRGDAVPHLRGGYVFGDYVRGTISAAAPTDEGYEVVELLATEHAISSFGVDADGEIIVVDYGDYDWETGELESPAGLYRIVPAGSD